MRAKEVRLLLGIRRRVADNSEHSFVKLVSKNPLDSESFCDKGSFCPSETANKPWRVTEIRQVYLELSDILGAYSIGNSSSLRSGGRSLTFLTPSETSRLHEWYCTNALNLNKHWFLRGDDNQ